MRQGSVFPSVADQNQSCKGRICVIQGQSKGSQSRNLDMGTEAKPTKNTVMRSLSIAFSTYFLIQPRSTCPGVTPCTVWLYLPYQLLLNKMPHRYRNRNRQIWCRQFHLEFPIPQVALFVSSWEKIRHSGNLI